ncbi:MAG: DNA replication/repair protein RecF [[Clostridium] aminophilum]|uniref:DNA replication/repair protein RecF n=1 Tax=[Clostridium] aminophilum TaxID=1526 RepID=UPI0026EF3406|nr:DNA replication/repair protein RecF [[Clostridium] aminophilum]MDD6195935.1 DNA replication/repair protein RecF [[Clostridium] aminophilum]
MKIESIDLKNFRNYSDLHLKFSDGINVFYGDNAQGKTNVLEAIYMCATSKSHRASREREMIRFGEEESHLRMGIRRDGVPGRIDIHLRKARSRGIAVGGIPIRRASELFGVINVVFFSPEDLGIVKNGPADRRRFVDMELCQLDRMYVHSLVSYSKVLQQRNQLLKDLYVHPDLEATLPMWDEQLVRYGTEVIRARREFVRDLNGILEDIHIRLSGHKEKLVIRYQPDTEEEEFADRLLAGRESDRRQKTTMTGPHRDDLGFFVTAVSGPEENTDDREAINIRRFGSQGQQRTAALSLKLAEIELVKRRIGDSPILLLDDVLSELDSGRQENLLRVLQGIQTFITCTGLDDFISHSFHIDRLFRVTGGHAEEADPADSKAPSEEETDR